MVDFIGLEQATTLTAIYTLDRTRLKISGPVGMRTRMAAVCTVAASRSNRSRLGTPARTRAGHLPAIDHKMTTTAKGKMPSKDAAA